MRCTSLKSIQLTGVRMIDAEAFKSCDDLMDVEFGTDLETIGKFAFCASLKRIAIPLKDDMIANTAFDNCDGLEQVVPNGRIHETISSLHLESWRKEMRREIKVINRALPTLNTEGIQTSGIQQWIESVLRKMEQFRAEHSTLVREAMTVLELALWKAMLDEEEDKAEIDSHERKAQRFKIDTEAVRRERRVMSGADVVIKNVLPFLKLLE